MLFKSLFSLTTLFIPTLSTPTPSQLFPRVIPNAGWTVKSFTRDCTGIYSTPACIYEFEISAGGGRPDFGCYVVDYTPDPIHSSFYSSPCNAHAGVDGGWIISWGYNAEFDFAVMTLVNRDLQEDAWFGWNDVSKNTVTHFQDVGPNAVYALGTFT